MGLELSLPLLPSCTFLLALLSFSHALWVPDAPVEVASEPDSL